MTDEAALRSLVRQRLATGALPRQSLRRAWGGLTTSRGGICHICDLALQINDQELQVEFAHENDPPYFEVLHLHARCFAAWELERDKA